MLRDDQEVTGGLVDLDCADARIGFVTEFREPAGPLTQRLTSNDGFAVSAVFNRKTSRRFAAAVEHQLGVRQAVDEWLSWLPVRLLQRCFHSVICSAVLFPCPHTN